jgi:hypothetical protein
MKKFTTALMVLALAVIPTTSFAQSAKERAKEKMREKAAAAAAEVKEVRKEKEEVKKAAAAVDDQAKKDEADMHTKHLGIIERLEQIATATANAELTTIVSRLKEKETKRHGLAEGA